MSGFGAIAQAQCFDNQTVAAKQLSADEMSFTFQTPMHLCDGMGYSSGNIRDAVVLIVRQQRDVVKKEKMAIASVVYFELNYKYWSGVGTWQGWQPVILTVEDKEHNDLLPNPIYNENTPRQVCRYGLGVPVIDARNLPNIFNVIAFVTMRVPRVTGEQHGC